MLGFLKRDLSLLAIGAKFYLVFVLLFAGLAVFTDFSSSFSSLYLVIFSCTSITGLFNYDDANHWEAYAAAAPNGRRGMVDARYLMALGLAAVVFLFQLLLGVITRTALLESALMWVGVLLLYAAVILPIAYRFGTKSRTVMVVVVSAFSALIAIGATSLHVFADGDLLAILGVLPLLALPLGAVALVVSHRISRHIMARKEL